MSKWTERIILSIAVAGFAITAAWLIIDYAASLAAHEVGLVHSPFISSVVLVMGAVPSALAGIMMAAILAGDIGWRRSLCWMTVIFDAGMLGYIGGCLLMMCFTSHFAVLIFAVLFSWTISVWGAVRLAGRAPGLQ